MSSARRNQARRQRHYWRTGMSAPLGFFFGGAGPFRGTGVPPVSALAGVADGRGAFFEQVAVPDGALAGVVGEFEILRELEGVGGAGVLAAAAEHAARQIVGKVGEHLAAALVVAGPADDDQILRAGQRAEVAGDAEGFAGFGIVVEAGGAAVALGHHGPLLRVLLGVAGARALVAEGAPQAREQVNQEQPLECLLPVHRPNQILPYPLLGPASSVAASGTCLSFRTLDCPGGEESACQPKCRSLAALGMTVLELCESC